MIIGIPREIKEHEYRVSITPAGVKLILKEGHRVIVEKSAGAGSGFSDEDYQKSGAEISDKFNLFRESGLIIKVKEPMSSEYDFFREGQALFTFLHLAPNLELTGFLIKKHIAALAYETLEEGGTTVLLTPMSEIAGKMAPVVAAFYLQKAYGGRGILVTGVEGVSPARVSVINRGVEKLQQIDREFRGKVDTFQTAEENIESEVLKADIVIGAVLISGARTPRLVSKGLVAKMKKGAVIVDVSVDQGGCIETIKPTTHNNPVYTVDGVIHYAVANMPGAYPRTSTLALTNKTLPYIRLLAKNGIEKAVRENEPLKKALNVYRGKIVRKELTAD